MAPFIPTSSALRRSLAVLALSSLGAAALAADATVNDRDFPAPESSYLKTGDFIGPDHVRRVMPGLNKDQVRLELGNPHFSEGLFAVREWDYVFNFYKDKVRVSDYVTCQFKVKFDGDHRVASTHWKGADCATYINPQAQAAPMPMRITVTIAVPGPALAIAPVAPARSRVVLAADGLFAFGKSGLEDLAMPGREKLDGLITRLKQDAVTPTSVTVTGHTDRMGSPASNLSLSRARAETVRSYLVRSGVDAQRLHAVGEGESKPVVQCAGEQVTPELVACLQPNRRVEIESIGEQ